MSAAWTEQELKNWITQAQTNPMDAARSFTFVSDLVDAYYHRSLAAGILPTLQMFQIDLRHAIQVIKTLK